MKHNASPGFAAAGVVAALGWVAAALIAATTVPPVHGAVPSPSPAPAIHLETHR